MSKVKNEFGALAFGLRVFRYQLHQSRSELDRLQLIGKYDIHFNVQIISLRQSLFYLTAFTLVHVLATCNNRW